MLQGIRKIAIEVLPTETETACPDDDDNRILEAAVAGGADCIVSGDRHLLRMGAFRGIQIVTVADFLARLGPEGSR